MAKWLIRDFRGDGISVYDIAGEPGCLEHTQDGAIYKKEVSQFLLLIEAASHMETMDCQLIHLFVIYPTLVKNDMVLHVSRDRNRNQRNHKSPLSHPVK